jgi:hypothetical protein
VLHNPTSKPKNKYYQSKNQCRNYHSLAYSLLLCIVGYSFVGLFPPPAGAATVSNDNFQIDIDQFDVAPEEQKKLPTPTPQPVEHGNFGVAAIPYSFSFSLSDPILDFGSLSATNPVTRTTNLIVSSPGNGYQVFAYQDHTLRSKKNAVIPETTCDNGSCTESTASLWQNNLTYGFGFRCDPVTKDACTKGFEEENSFKQFSDHGKKEIPQAIMSNDSPILDQQIKLTYRLNISGTQAKEAYANTVTYIAVPNF